MCSLSGGLPWGKSRAGTQLRSKFERRERDLEGVGSQSQAQDEGSELPAGQVSRGRIADRFRRLPKTGQVYRYAAHDLYGNAIAVLDDNYGSYSRLYDAGYDPGNFRRRENIMIQLGE